VIRYLSLTEVLELHKRIIQATGGSEGLRDLGALEAAVAQPLMTYGGDDLYSTLMEKTAALGYSLINNHPFVDGNKRVGHATMAVFLYLNGYQISVSIDVQEAFILGIAAGKVNRDQVITWLNRHVKEADPHPSRG